MQASDGAVREGAAPPGDESGRPGMRIPRRIILAAVLAALLLTGPSRAISTVLRTVHQQASFLPAFSAEPTVTVSIGRPAEDAWVARMVSVEATVLADVGVARVWTVAGGHALGEVVPPATPTSWLYSAVWDSSGTAEGTTTIAVVAQDVAGRTATATVAARVDHTPPRVAVFPRAIGDAWTFSPNGDGRRDTLDVSIISSEPVVMNAVVVGAGRSRVLLAAGHLRSSAAFVWDGRMSTSTGARPLADGRYPIAVHVLDPAGNSVDATYQATVDTAPPQVKWLGSAPRGFWPAKRQRGVFVLRVADTAATARLAAEVTNDASAVVRRLAIPFRPIGVMRLVWDGKYRNRRVVPPGQYVVHLAATDGAGNSIAVAGRPVVVHAIRKPTRIARVRTMQKVVALTFDDLYSQSRTEDILRILADNGVKATFFPVGDAAMAHPGLMREIVAAGHAIGDHSTTHPVMTKLAPAAQRAQIRGCEQRVLAATGRTTAPLFRPPYGATNSQLAASAAAEEHPCVMLWDVDTRDWASPGVNRIIYTVDSGVRPGSIVLMHGGPPQTPKALPTIIHDLKAKGYRMVTLPELLWIGGYR